MVIGNNWAGFDTYRREAFQRSLTIGTAGTVLLQTTISRVVQMVTLREMGVQSTLPRKPGSGDGFYSQRRAASSPGAQWLDDTTEPTDAEGTYTQVKFGFKSLIGRVKITRKLIRQGQTYGDVMAIELTGKAEDFAQELEEASVKGDTGVTPNSIDGLITLINAVAGQVVANTTVIAGDDIFLAQVDKAIQLTKGSANKASMRIYGSFAGHRKLNNALQAQQRFDKVTEIEGGFTVASYSGIAIIESTSVPDDMLTTVTTGVVVDITGEATNPTTCLIFVNTNYVFYVELTPMTVLPLAKKSSQYDEIDMFTDLTLAQDNPKGATLLTSISVD